MGVDMNRKIIDYHPGLRITNTEQLPRGTGAKFLLVIESPHDGEYAAERWLRKMPSSIPPSKAVVRMHATAAQRGKHD